MWSPVGSFLVGTEKAGVSESEVHGQGRLSLAPGAELAEGVACVWHTLNAAEASLWGWHTQ